jgi:hypothetical protein
MNTKLGFPVAARQAPKLRMSEKSRDEIGFMAE